MKLIPILSLLALFLLPSCDGTAQQQPAEKPAVQNTAASGAAFQNVPAARFKELMADPNAVVLDVRTAPEVASGALPNAVHIDINSPDFAGKVSALDKSKTYLVYCRSGKRSAAACSIMEKQGFTSIYNLQGGILTWKE